MRRTAALASPPRLRSTLCTRMLGRLPNACGKVTEVSTSAAPQTDVPVLRLTSTSATVGSASKTALSWGAVARCGNAEVVCPSTSTRKLPSSAVHPIRTTSFWLGAALVRGSSPPGHALAAQSKPMCG
eukprot:scaffold228_cov312-Pinguiococcus_pyrenoidosus.AAC.59